MEVTIKINGQALSVEVSVEVYERLDRADHKEENLAHEKRRHWDIQEFDECIVATEGCPPHQETPEEYVNRQIAADNRLLKEIKARIMRLYNWSKEQAVTPKQWRAEADTLAAKKDVLYQEMRAMQEKVKAVEQLRKAAEQLAKNEQTKHREESDR